LSLQTVSPIGAFGDDRWVNEKRWIVTAIEAYFSNRGCQRNPTAGGIIPQAWGDYPPKAWGKAAFFSSCQDNDWLTTGDSITKQLRQIWHINCSHEAHAGVGRPFFGLKGAYRPINSCLKKTKSLLVYVNSPQRCGWSKRNRSTCSPLSREK